MLEGWNSPAGITSYRPAAVATFCGSRQCSRKLTWARPRVRRKVSVVTAGSTARR
jgi:hypothetical protein